MSFLIEYFIIKTNNQNKIGILELDLKTPSYIKFLTQVIFEDLES